MCRAYLLLFLITAAQAETPTDAPEEAPRKVEAALRARVSQFYQFEVEGKFRQAEPLVAEEAKDFYYSANKPRYLGFKIKHIEYHDNFKRAIVVVSVDRVIPIPGFEGKAVPGAVPSHWKLEKGKWCWYVDPSDIRSSPFAGALPPMGGAAVPGGPPRGTPPSLPPMPNMTGSVGIDKRNVDLKTLGPSSEHVTLVNQLKTPVTLLAREPNPAVAGLTVKLDHTDLKPAGQAILEIAWAGSGPAPTQPVMVTVVVKQTNQVIPIKVAFVEAPKQ